MIKRVAKMTWEIASTATIVSMVVVVGIADQIVPRETADFMKRHEPQTEQLIQFLLSE